MSKQQPFYERPLCLPVGETPGITIQRDIPYLDEDGDGDTRLDIYLPAGDTPAVGYPYLLFVPGGPVPQGSERPSPKEWRVFQDYGRLAAANGLAGVVINHRYTSYEALMLAVGDVLQARQFLAQQGSTFGLDGQRFALWAFSGAGMLISPFLRGDVPGLQAILAFYPMLDLTHVPKALEAYSEEQLITLSPLSHIETMPRLLPVYLARAGLDRPGLNRALDTFVKQALYHNTSLELRNLPESGHGFDMLESSAEAAAAVQRGLDFVKEHLPAGAG